MSGAGAMLALAIAATTADEGGTSIERASRMIADRVSTMVPAGNAAVAIHLYAGVGTAPELARAVETTLLSRLAQVMNRPPTRSTARSMDESEAEARAQGADLLLRLWLRVEYDELVIAGDLLSTWVNFWTGLAAARGPGGGAVAVRVQADAEVLTLSGASPEASTQGAADPMPESLRIRYQWQFPESIVALAVGDIDGQPGAEVAVLTPSSVQVFSLTYRPRLTGKEIDPIVRARRERIRFPRVSRPPREPASAISIGQWSGDGEGPRIAYRDFGDARGEILSYRDGALEAVGPFDGVPISGGELGLLVATPVPGRHVVSGSLRRRNGGATVELPFAPVLVAGNPRAGAPSLVAVAPDGSVELVGADLANLSKSLTPLGVPAALGDLDGDGTPELVTMLFGLDADRVRVLKLDARTPTVVFEQAVEGSFVAAAGDLNADGVDEVVLAAPTDGGSSLFILGRGVP